MLHARTLCQAHRTGPAAAAGGVAGTAGSGAGRAARAAKEAQAAAMAVPAATGELDGSASSATHNISGDVAHDLRSHKSVRLQTCTCSTVNAGTTDPRRQQRDERWDMFNPQRFYHLSQTRLGQGGHHAAQAGHRDADQRLGREWGSRWRRTTVRHWSVGTTSRSPRTPVGCCRTERWARACPVPTCSAGKST